MKVINLYPPNAKKLCHRSPGDVVRVCKNDISFPDDSIYIVIEFDDRTHSMLVNLVTGERRKYHSSSRCIHYPKAAVALNGSLEEEENN